MPVEIFDKQETPDTMISIAIYNTGGEIVPSWWISIKDGGREHYDIDEIRTIIDCMPSIAAQLQKLVDFFS